MTNQINEKIVEAMTRLGDAIDSFIERNDGTFKDLTDRVEKIEAGASSPGRTAQTREGVEHTKLFVDWIRKPSDSHTMNALGDFEAHAKDVTIGTGSAGGFAVPTEIGKQIERLELKFSPVRRLVKVVQVSTPSYTEIVSLSDATSGWVGETGTRSATNTPQLREVAPTFGELYAYPQVSEWSLDDIFFNVSNWLAEEVARQFALQEGQAVLTGDGTNKPTGMLNTTPVATDDWASPLRAAAAYEFIVSLGDDSPVVAEVQPDSLIDLVFSVNSAYRANGTFVMNSATAAAVRKLKDTTGQYLWAQGLAAGQPDRLLG
jgi:HK97 family phage major capsid protein